jgi:hypothetical protein
VRVEEIQDLGNGVVYVVQMAHRAATERAYLELGAACVYQWVEHTHTLARMTLYSDNDEARAAAERLATGACYPQISRRIMPRVIVISEPVHGRRRRSLTLDEHINPVHMADEHSSLQFLERLAWAISDAEEAEQRFEVTLTP